MLKKIHRTSKPNNFVKVNVPDDMHNAFTMCWSMPNGQEMTRLAYFANGEA